jgi:hypothetical protein
MPRNAEITNSLSKIVIINFTNICKTGENLSPKNVGI